MFMIKSYFETRVLCAMFTAIIDSMIAYKCTAIYATVHNYINVHKQNSLKMDVGIIFIF